MSETAEGQRKERQTERKLQGKKDSGSQQLNQEEEEEKKRGRSARGAPSWERSSPSPAFSDSLFFPAGFVFLRPVGYFGPSVSEQLGMDAIMLQEKLVERLLCPRVRTARQKVKRKKKCGSLSEDEMDECKKRRQIILEKDRIKSGL